MSPSHETFLTALLLSLLAPCVGLAQAPSLPSSSSPLFSINLGLGLFLVAVVGYTLYELHWANRLSAQILDARRPDDHTPGLDLDGARGMDGVPNWVRPVIDQALPKRYGDFEVLGEGGMGIVLKATDRQLKRPVAIKIPPPHISSMSEFRIRFIREARAMAALEHPNIGRIYDAPEVAEGEVPVLVMEYLQGEDLASRVKSKGAVPIRELVAWLQQAGAGLQYAHDRGIIHRDIKPPNLFRETNGRIKVLDFGLVSIQDASQLTMTGMTFGTAPFMPPEQMRDGCVDPSADQYSLASTGYYLACGKLPYEISDQFRMSPKPLSGYLPKSPKALDAVFCRALSGMKAERYPSIREFVDALGTALVA